MKKLLVAMLVSLMVLLGIASADIVGDFTVTGGVNGVDYTFDATTKLLTVTTGTELTIYTSKTTNHGIVLDPGAGNETNIKLAGVKITATGSYSCIDVKSGTANITANGDNTLIFSGSDNRAAIHVPYGTKLVRTDNGTGWLYCTVTTGMGAAIGGNGNSGDKAELNGTIILNSGVNAQVTATTQPGAAIGTGSSVSGGKNLLLHLVFAAGGYFFQSREFSRQVQALP